MNYVSKNPICGRKQVNADDLPTHCPNPPIPKSNRKSQIVNRKSNFSLPKFPNVPNPIEESKNRRIEKFPKFPLARARGNMVYYAPVRPTRREFFENRRLRRVPAREPQERRPRRKPGGSGGPPGRGAERREEEMLVRSGRHNSIIFFLRV